MDGGHSSSLHHPTLPSPPSAYQPPSPASSTDESSQNSIDRIFPKPTHLPPLPPDDYSGPDQNHIPQGGIYPVNADSAAFPPDHHHYHSRRSPPPEPSFPVAHPSHQPAWAAQHYPYTRHPSPAVAPPPRARAPTAPAPAQASSRTAPPPVWPSAPSPPQDDPDARIDQLIDLDTDNPPSDPDQGPSSSQSPPQAPAPASGSIHLPAPSYLPHLHYPISPPGSESHSSRTFSFISLPGNAMRKRPRRRYDEIERLYRCNWEGCTKSYGTLNHLNAHVSMQRHGQKRTPGEFKEMRKMWRKQKREAEMAEVDDEGDDSGSGMGPSLSPSTSAVLVPGPSSSTRSKRKRRVTDPALPTITTLDDEAKLEDEYATSHLHRPDLDLSRRVSADDYRIAEHDRRGSGGSGDGDTQGDDASDDASGAQLSMGPAMVSGPMGPAIHGSLHPGGHSGGSGHDGAGSPALPPSLPPMGMEGPGPSASAIQFWPQHPPSTVSQQHQVPISPTTVVPPVSHLPGPGPVSGVSLPHQQQHHPQHQHLHQRQMSFPPPPSYSSGPLHAPQHQQQAHHQTMQHPVYPPSVQMPVPHHAPSVPYPPFSGPQLHTPPPHLQQHHHHQTHLRQPHQHTASPPTHPSYTASPPPPIASVQPLHQGSMLITPVSIGHPHRTSYPSDAGTDSPTIPAAGYGASGSAQGLPSVFDRALPTRGEPVDDDRGGGGGGGGGGSAVMPPVVQHVQQQQQQQAHAPSWDAYAPGPSHRQQAADTPYSVPPAPPPLTRAPIGYDPARDYQPPPRPDVYGGQQRGDQYVPPPQQQQQYQHQRHDQHPYMSQRSVSYSGASGSSSLDPYGAQQQQRQSESSASSYIPSRSDSYGPVQPQHPPRGDPGQHYQAPPPRQDHYAAHRQQQQQQYQQEQPQYQPLPPTRHLQQQQPPQPLQPQQHPQQQHPHQLPPPPHLPPHPDSRLDPYGRGQPGPSEGSYQ